MHSLTALCDDPGKNERFCRDVFMCGKGTGNFRRFCRSAAHAAKKCRKPHVGHGQTVGDPPSEAVSHSLASRELVWHKLRHRRPAATFIFGEHPNPPEKGDESS